MFLAAGVTWIIVGLVVLVLAGFVIANYNKLVELRNRVKNQWHQIDVQLKRRFDMIPNLAETVKGFAKHEESIFGEFAKARGLYAQASQSGSVGEMAEANKGLTGALSRLMVVQEQYPELKSDTHFQQMMKDLKETEDKIAYQRQFYNDVVQINNNKVEMFPGNIVAKMFGFKSAEFFALTEEGQREAPKVSF
ncbi:MAG TPA: LemA family protein [Bacilli bacterium]|nr:LemA family protein [Bacilli bacterium]